MSRRLDKILDKPLYASFSRLDKSSTNSRQTTRFFALYHETMTNLTSGTTRVRSARARA